jgi:hypothetical protein
LTLNCNSINKSNRDQLNSKEIKKILETPDQCCSRNT